MRKLKYNSPTISTLIRIPKRLKEGIYKKAMKKDQSFSEYVIRLMEADLDK